MRGRRMNLEKIAKMIDEYYDKARNTSYIQKPLAWALYQVWKYVDEHEQPTGTTIIEAEADDEQAR